MTPPGQDQPRSQIPGTEPGEGSSRPAAAELLPAALAARYDALSVLGTGGMGVVLRVHDRQLGREVALKLLRQESPAALRLFEIEARALASLEHDHIVRVYDFGFAGDTPYLLMELVAGASLSLKLAEGRPPVAETVRIVRDMMRGLAAAHARGIVHRDVKPGNVFLEVSGRAKVADFGLARFVSGALSAGGASDEGESSDGSGLVGTPGYMAPEQASGEAAGPAADVYAAGVVLHEMLTGDRLFRARTLVELFSSQLMGPPPAPSASRPGVPAVLDGLVTRCLAPDPSGRPSSAEMLEQLERWLAEVDTHRGERLRRVTPPEPYKLLAHFDVGDAPIFFGRDAEVGELTALLESPARMLVIFGPCGVGKSSVLRAGLVGSLDPGRFECLVSSPGADPVAGILATLAARLGEAPGEATTEQLRSLASRVAAAAQRELLLVLDQMEEVFTQNPRGSPRVARLFHAIEGLVRAEGLPVKVLLSYRTEFRGDFFPLEERLARQTRAVQLRPMGLRGLAEAIDGPARLGAYRFSFEPGLPERLAREITQAGTETQDKSLPLLQIVCRRLHEHMLASGRAVIDARLYERSLGGARGALERHVTERLTSAEYAYHGALARQMLTALTVKEGASERFSHPRDEDELTDFPDRPAAARTLERLVGDHLVVRESSPGGGRRVRLASEVICGLIDVWASEPDASERARRQLARSFRQWHEHGGRDEDLLAGAALALVETNAGALRDAGPRELTFLARSIAGRGARRIRAGSLVGAVALALTALIWTAFLAPGRVVLRTHPSGAEVRLGGRLLGITPLDWEARPGRYELAISRARHDSMLQEVIVPAGGEAVYQPILPYPHGLLTLASTPSGASCVIRGAAGDAPLAVLRTPFTTELPTGEYQLELGQSGHVTRTAVATIAANREHTQLTLVLAKDTGGLLVRTAFAGCELVVRAKVTGRTVLAAALPLKVPAELTAGSYTLSISGSQRSTTEASVEISRGVTTELSLWLPPLQPLWCHPQTADGRPLVASEMAPPERVSAPALGDLDGDGRPEVVLGRLDRSIVALSASSGRTVWTHATTAPIAVAPALADLDRDGKLDVIAVCADGSVRAVAGLSGRQLWQAAVPDAGGAPPVCADLDADGTLDAVVASAAGAVTALSGRTGSRLWISPAGAALTAGPALADVDADGIADVLTGGAGGALAALSGKSGAALWTRALAGGACRALTAVEMDGGPALLVGCADGRLRRLDARDGAERWSRAIGPAGGPPAVADLDRDGAPDVLAGTTDGHLWALSGKDGHELWRAAPGGPVLGRPALADLDGDGVLDVLVPGGDARILGVSGTTGRTLRDIDALRLTMCSSPVVADLDGNGSPDVVVRGPSDVTLAFPLEQEQVDWAVQTADQPVGAEAQARPPWTAVGDLDGDAAADVLLDSEDGRVVALAGRDGRRLWTSVRLARSLLIPPAVGDLDGDGRTEVIVATVHGDLMVLAPSNGRVLRHERLGHPCTAPPVLVELDREAGPDILLGLTGHVRAFAGRSRRVVWTHAIAGRIGMLSAGPGPEGKPDIVYSTTDREVVALSGGDGVRRWSTKDRGLLLAGPAPADLNGDGVADVVTARPGGLVAALSGRSGERLWEVRCDGPVDRQPAVGDLDGDGRPEVVVSVGTGAVQALAPDGRTIWIVRTGLEVGELLLFDLDGDGGQDVLGVGVYGKLFGLSGRGRAPIFVRDLLLTGHLGTAAIDRAAFQRRGAVTWSGALAAWPASSSAERRDVALVTLRVGPTVVQSRLSLPQSTR